MLFTGSASHGVKPRYSRQIALNSWTPCPSHTLAELLSYFNHLSASEEQMYSMGLAQPFTPHFFSLEWQVNEVDGPLSEANVYFQFIASQILHNMGL